jgi:hypothetical protein
MVYGCEGNLCSDLVIEILEHCIVKILGIVDYDVPGNAIATDDILLEELFDVCRAYVCDEFCLNGEGVIALCWS